MWTVNTWTGHTDTNHQVSNQPTTQVGHVTAVLVLTEPSAHLTVRFVDVRNLTAVLVETLVRHQDTSSLVCVPQPDQHRDVTT